MKSLVHASNSGACRQSRTMPNDEFRPECRCLHPLWIGVEPADEHFSHDDPGRGTFPKAGSRAERSAREPVAITAVRSVSATGVKRRPGSRAADSQPAERLAGGVEYLTPPLGMLIPDRQQVSQDSIALRLKGLGLLAKPVDLGHGGHGRHGNLGGRGQFYRHGALLRLMGGRRSH
jgi:hypothetical protein